MSTATIAKPPNGDCPKCGTPWAFMLAEPRYDSYSYRNSRDDLMDEERLLWPCKRCGYEASTPTMDADR